ncbi:MAG: circularly permuted type 2 ATP-grasp protein [Alphaproteobacteria bacterium]
MLASADEPDKGLIAAYRTIPGTADEMLDAEGNTRPGWTTLISALERAGPEALAEQFARADQYLRDAGVFYRVYGAPEAAERAWPLAHLPLLIDEDEWRGIAEGVAQRAELLERVAADIYGENRLVAQGLLPAELVAASPEFLRPMVGIAPAGGRFLHFCAFDLGRGPDGRWWVLGDRTQAPSGAGFALENRVATTRALGKTYGVLNVTRLAGFFRDFRDALLNFARQDGGRVAVLSPGPHNETYYEHAYIARYLGFMLLEGEDLSVRDGRVMVRTIDGGRPVSVLWRRLDAAFTDPLELNPLSQIGTPGLVEAVRQGSVSLVNALGAGVLESRALLAFLPRIAEALGQGLTLPNIATWWCGDAAARDHVAAHFDEMVIGPALSTRLTFEDDGETALGASLDEAARAAVRARLERDGGSLVGQEAVTLSTTPVYVDGRLEPRPVSLRVFAARTADGWTVMPGGLARVGFTLDTKAIAMQQGGQAADVWVMAKGPIAQISLIPQDESAYSRVMGGVLPARAADSLFWLGRYIERAESLLRILRAYHARLAESGTPELPLLADVRAYLGGLQIEVEPAIPAGLARDIDSAVYSASQIRDRFSADGWLALNDLKKTVARFSDRVEPGDDATGAMTVLLRKLAGFAGLVYENMYRFTGWRFLEIGRRLERAMQLAWTLAWLTRADAPEGAADLAIEIGDSQITHRRRYSVRTGSRSVLDLLVLDALNPRSIAFQVARMREQIEQLPHAETGARLPATVRDVLRLDTDLRTADADALTTERLHGLAGDLAALASSLGRTYLT